MIKARIANEHAYRALLLTCLENKFFWIVFNAKTKKLPSYSASLAGEKLKIKFESIQRTQEFMKSQVQKGESPDDWIEHIFSISSRIEQIQK